MSEADSIVVLSLDEQRYALWLSSVERVLPALFVTPLPKAPEIVLGVIDVQGEIVPVVDLRKRFRLPPRDMALDDHVVLARSPRRRLALVVDKVAGVEVADRAQCVGVEALPPGSGYVAGLVKTKEGLVLIHDLGTFLGLEEERALDAALEATRGVA